MLYTEARLPRWPTLDEIIAYGILEDILKRPLQISFMNKDRVLTNAELQELNQQGVLLVGFDKKVGPNEEAISSTASMVDELRSVGGLPAEDNVLDELARMLARDNQDGYLTKSQPFAAGFVAQSAYRHGYDHQEVVYRTAHVGQVLVKVMTERSNGRPDLASHEHAKLTPAMALLPEKAPRTHCGPFTVSRYIRDMYTLGYTDADMVARASWFIEIHNQAKVQRAAADNAAITQTFEKFRLAGQTKIGLWVQSDDPYLMAALATDRYDLVAMRSSKGNVIVMSKSFDLSHVAHDLMTKEPDRWYYGSGQRNMLANGTERVQRPPTQFSRDEIVQSISLNVVRKSM